MSTNKKKRHMRRLMTEDQMIRTEARRLRRMMRRSGSDRLRILRRLRLKVGDV